MEYYIITTNDFRTDQYKFSPGTYHLKGKLSVDSNTITHPYLHGATITNTEITYWPTTEDYITATIIIFLLWRITKLAITAVTEPFLNKQIDI